MATIGRRPAIALWLAVRLSFEDAGGASLWTTVNGIALPRTPTPDPGWRLTHTWFDRIVEAHSLDLAAASLRMHEAQLAMLRADVRAALSRLLVRERAILDRLAADAARLAAPLVDVGLFDRRALRQRDAQRRVADEAAARAGERIGRLERQMQPQPGRRELVFAVAWRR